MTARVTKEGLGEESPVTYISDLVKRLKELPQGSTVEKFWLEYGDRQGYGNSICKK